jgi:hypothetical protein
MNNGTRKGEPILPCLYESPGLEDLIVALGLQRGTRTRRRPSSQRKTTQQSPEFSATSREASRRRWRFGGAAHSRYLIRSAQQDGTFTVTNTRNSFSKTYQARP